MKKRDVLNTILCPICNSPMEFKNNKAICKNCGSEFPIQDDVIFFEESKNYYWGGLLDPVEMNIVIKEAYKSNWLNALNLIPPYKTTVIQNIIDERRSAWHFLLPLKERNLALDFGCGMGSITMGLARNFDNVFACDRTKERTKFTVLRAKQENLNNVIGLVGFRDVRKLPFSSNSFDLVVLYGVLEWVAEELKGNPQEIQGSFLSECKRILKKNGFLIIAIENATAIKYLRGGRDDHAHELKYTTFLPRFLSNWISWKVRNRPYRTYIYSFNGYKRLFNNAGLHIYKVYYPIPDYRDFYKLIDLESHKAIKDYFESLKPSKKKRLIYWMGLFKWFIPGSYLWILKK